MQGGEGAWAAHTEPPEAAANMFMTRLAFDLLRAPAFQTATAAYVQRKLDQLRYPPFIGPLKVRLPPWCLLSASTPRHARAAAVELRL